MAHSCCHLQTAHVSAALHAAKGNLNLPVLSGFARGNSGASLAGPPDVDLQGKGISSQVSSHPEAYLRDHPTKWFPVNLLALVHLLYYSTHTFFYLFLS